MGDYSIWLPQKDRFNPLAPHLIFDWRGYEFSTRNTGLFGHRGQPAGRSHVAGVHPPDSAGYDSRLHLRAAGLSPPPAQVADDRHHRRQLAADNLSDDGDLYV